ncbi:putative P450 monooxygenase [Trichoderma asperelloides]|nr:putative P450 monooxygenase [Trichoderma asperelloides]
MIYRVYSCLTRNRPYVGIPIAQIEQKGIHFLIQLFLPGLSWMISPQEVLANGKAISKTTDGIYQLRASGGYKIVLPRRYAEEIRNNEYMTFGGSCKKDFHSTQPGFEAMLEGLREDGLVIDAVHKLVQNLGVILPSMIDEADFSITKWFGDKEDEWRTFKLNDAAVDIVARIVTRATIGIDFARNEEWIRISRDHAVSTFISSVILHQVPALLRPFLVWIIPECRKLRKQVADSKRLLAPKVRAIEKELRDGRKRPTTADVFTWLLDVAKGRHINFVLAQMSISEASIHSTSEMLTRMIIQCCKTPELVNDLREEIARVLEEEGGWSKAAPYKMKLVDSFMREISRHQPMGIAGMLRDVRRDVKLSNGVVLPAGGLVMVEDDGLVDPDVNPHPESFDARRYLHLRQQPNGEARHQFVTTSPDNLLFGLGNNQCPGRQFASNEIKIMFSFMLLRYDWRFPPGFTLPSPVYFESRVAAPITMVQCRRRQEVKDLLKVKIAA